MPNDVSAWAAILLIAGVTFGSRMAGALLMRHVAISRRVEVFLDAVSISVVATLVASLLAQNGAREATAVVVASLVMLVFKSPVAAMTVGMITAGLWALIESV